MNISRLHPRLADVVRDPFSYFFNYSSHTWHVNSAEPSLWLTLLMTSSTRSACRYFSLYPGTFLHAFFTLSLEKMVESTCRTCGIPMLTAIPLLTLPQFIMLHTSKGKRKVGLDCHCMTNIILGLGINITPVVFTGVSGHDDLCVWIFKRIRNNLENSDKTKKNSRW